jgi:hypothetical protein
MSTATEPSRDEGAVRAATNEEIRLFEWAEEVQKKSLNVVTDSLKQLVTLTIALLGGTAALYNQLPVAAPFKALFFITLLGTLGVSLWGMYPIVSRIECVEDIRDAREKSLPHRLWFLWLASVLLFAAFGFLAFSLLLASLW